MLTIDKVKETLEKRFNKVSELKEINLRSNQKINWNWVSSEIDLGVGTILKNKEYIRIANFNSKFYEF